MGNSISEHLGYIYSTLPQDVKLVAVSKFHPLEALQEAYNYGQRDFGESRVQELVNKHSQMPSDTRWHFIGHLQTNKVKYILPFIYLIHSVDSIKLLDEIEKQAAKAERIINVLLEVHVAQEASKSGFTIKGLFDLFDNNPNFLFAYPHIRIRGLMGMASHTEDEEQIQKEFRKIFSLHQRLIAGPLKNIETENFRILSFGMSEDYLIAIKEGANMVRIGSAIFGERG